MEDLLFALGLVAFFGLCLAYVRFCDSVIGPDATEATSTPAAGRQRVESVVR